MKIIPEGILLDLAPYLTFQFAFYVNSLFLKVIQLILLLQSPETS